MYPTVHKSYPPFWFHTWYSPEPGSMNPMQRATCPDTSPFCPASPHLILSIHSLRATKLNRNLFINSASKRYGNFHLK
ncbi:hypothetical protein L1987_19979 [Smallanthus sonchifolius]|uniref:Uncharacterized protein n=1 Tax=Smallanthus sonchifolius TaxID=185202 RepID=A0ACB9IQI8_9ASTR|nr:hypothetical protein L1987_19979 [Smallanthus sonchifolius]